MGRWEEIREIRAGIGATNEAALKERGKIL
jgi:hypothetical protein